MTSYETISRKIPQLRQKAGGGSLFEKALFEDVVLAAPTQYERVTAKAGPRRRKLPVSAA